MFNSISVFVQQTHSAKHGLEPGFIPQIIEDGIDVEIGGVGVFLVYCLIQPDEGLIR